MYLSIKGEMLKLEVTLEIFCVRLGHFYWVVFAFKHLCFVDIIKSSSCKVTISSDEYAGLSHRRPCVLVVSVVSINQFWDPNFIDILVFQCVLR